MVANVPTTPALETVAFVQTIVPREPDNVNVEPVFGIHKLSTPDIVPATDGKLYVTLTAVVVPELHAPLVNNTRYHVLSVIVSVIEFAAFVAAVGAIALPTFVQLILSVDFCHWIVPTVPDAKVNVALFDVEHTEAGAVIVLTTTTGLTNTMKFDVDADSHTPFFNVALYAVVAVNAPVANVVAV